MAKIIGEAGGRIAHQSGKNLRQMIAASILATGWMALIAGYTLCLSLQTHLLPLSLAVVEIGLFGIASYWIHQWIKRHINQREEERMKLRKDVLGEAAVGYILEALPDGYVVFNDLRTLSGNIDHVVIGPTGIFVIDTMNWRGAVTPNGQGELLCNGRPTGGSEVKLLLALITSLREKINILTQREDFIQGILAFPLARVEAQWGTTRNVQCLADERIIDYIRKYRFSNPIKKSEIELIEQAFHALAGMKADPYPVEGALIVLPATK
ncbi:MAG: nuclease-related domain-containing protein [Chthoniobacteraceae bacterium]